VKWSTVGRIFVHLFLMVVLIALAVLGGFQAAIMFFERTATWQDFLALLAIVAVALVVITIWTAFERTRW